MSTPITQGAGKDLTNAGFLQRLTSALTNPGEFFGDMNAAENQIAIKEAARRRATSRGVDEDGNPKAPYNPMDETGLPQITAAEWISGLRRDGTNDRELIQRQTSANNIGKTVNQNFTSEPIALQKIDRARQSGEDDFSYYTRLLGSQDSALAIRDAIAEGVPKELLQADTQLSPTQVQKITEDYNTNQGIIKDIGGEEKGAKLLAAARAQLKDGERLNTEQLRAVLVDAQNQDTDTVLSRGITEDNGSC